MKKVSFRKRLMETIVVFDGAMGTALQNSGLPLGVSPETFNTTHPELIQKIHLAYLEAGADVITANTFGANALKFDAVELCILNAVNNAKLARKQYYQKYGTETEKLIALDLGPLGVLLEPTGKLTFDEAYHLYRQQVLEGVRAGCDLILIETITDLLEAKCAILASIENSDLPVVCTMSYEASGRTFFGTDVVSMVTALEGLGVEALGFNCSFGGNEMIPLIETARKHTNLPIIVQPNAGLPQIIDSLTVFDKDYDHFKEIVGTFITLGVRGIGGCCGTDAKHIETIRQCVDAINLKEHHLSNEYTPRTRVASYSKQVNLGEKTTVIGERLNPTGKKRLKEALTLGDYDYVLREAILQVEQGAQILDINVGVPGIDEPAVMKNILLKIQSILNVPLQIDSSNVSSIEVGARYYNGKPLINSVNGKKESLDAILPIVKRYGACVIGLTLDETGIPSLAEARYKIAEKIVLSAEKLGIPRENIVIDCLALTASAQQAEVLETLKTIQMVKSRLGVCTALGVSNVSFGLPERERINVTFLTMALAAGLDAPIINPGHSDMMSAIAAYEVLSNKDPQSKRYIEKYGQTNIKVNKPISESTPESPESLKSELIHAIQNGLKRQAFETTEKLVASQAPLLIVDEIIIPTLNRVGVDYEQGNLFLPQLIQSAETVQAVFEVLKQKLESSGKAPINRGKILLATVQHDIHDIGKNIIKVVLENYGYQIFDLGKDVTPETILEKCLEHEITLVGLSALMTTTVYSMQKTIELLRNNLEGVVIVVGGAVLNTETANLIGADFYAKDASDLVKIAQKHYQG